ncbi:NAD(P)/FAD-dependent oxidoreductase [Mycobacterium riyadhense]|uniref:Oxidoreductase n=1 Tax=Mycobacterium riyadhense TaxID=486698 RepID=A0A1X2D5H9_9MYCO|nr:FAD-dependent monooxygenase [Mycobacterium riyadhense]MCV7148450.1 FAD-dependent monooxygenase [Mycobacterium riyadhense]ORW83428.1 oxidoreductase [Mycobacterium riyadhense]
MRGRRDDTRDHAVVIGASIAGLCAARVLSDCYSRVTVFERDQLPSGPASRATVPQDRHLHMLMTRGANEFESLFPGLLNDMVAAGVPMLRTEPQRVYLGAAGHVLGTGRTLRKEFNAYVPSRPHLEWQLRRRVLEIGNVEIVRRSVAEPRFERGQRRVTGVLLDSVGGDQEFPEFIAADLVVDAAGRGTRLPVWLAQWGYRRPTEQTVDVGITYATQKFRLPEGSLDENIVIAGASHDRSYGIGILRNEDDTWVLTAFGVANAKPPPTFDDMRALAAELLPARFGVALKQAEPVGNPARHAYPVSRWRRYDRVRRFPAGIVAVGDAVASFNPTYGQGMTMTSLQAGHLRRALEFPDRKLAGKLNRATARTTYPVWMSNGIGDVSFHNATASPAPIWWRPFGALFDQFLEEAETEPALAEWFLRRFSLLDSLYMVPSPLLVGRAIANYVRRAVMRRRSG